MFSDVLSDQEARMSLKEGLDLVSDTVKKTMGVRGKNVVLDTNPHGRPLITNDGVTISRNIRFKNKRRELGRKLINEAAEKTNDNAGDGTTTTMLLMQAMVENGMKAIASGADGIELRKGINEALKKVLKYLETEKVGSTDEETLAAVATISCRNPEIGKLVAKVVKQSGVDGMVTLEDRFESDTVYEQHEGIKLTGGYLHEMFINLPERQQTSFTDVPILVTDKTISLIPEMIKIMEVVANMGKKEAVVIANGIDGHALLTAMANWQNKNIHILPVRVISYGDLGQGMLKDVAAITGAVYLDEHEKNIIDITAEDFGRAARVVTDKHNTTVISDNETYKKERIQELQAAMEDASEFEQENLKRRIAKLNSAMFTIKVGGVTESERDELKTRVDDAIKAAKAALESGVVAGGGTALYRASLSVKKPDVTKDSGIGESIVYKACIRPIEQMALNSGYRLDRSDLKDIQDKELAIDFSDGKVVDAFSRGIIDPLKVVTECISNAASQAGLFLTIDAAVIDEEDREESL